MKAIIESCYYIRQKPVSSYISFPVYSDQIEKTLAKHLDFLNSQDSDFTLTLKIVKNNS